MAAAPELPGALELGRRLSALGITASIGHSDALLEDVAEAMANGYKSVTHFYSGCSMLKRKNSYRYPGVVEAGYLFDSLNVEVIADGKHLPASLLQLIYKVKGPDKICLVTDAQRFAASAIEGNTVYDIDGLDVIYEDDVLKLADRSAFAGSVATADRLVRNMITITNCGIENAVKMAAENPAHLVGYGDSLGRIDPGYRADMVIFDDNINVYRTIVNGESVFCKT